MKTIEFSGYQWIVRHGDEERHGPGPNYFSSSPENAWVDVQGQLHLKITNRQNRWYCAEVFLENPLGYGEYEFFTNGRFDQLDPQVVVGLFLYCDDEHEIDIEFGRWGKVSGDNLQYVLQPSHLPGNIYKYEARLNGDYTSHRIVWRKNSASFRSLHDHYTGETHLDHQVITQWTFGKAYHTPTTERVHMNLWLVQGQAPSSGKEFEMVITRFTFHH